MLNKWNNLSLKVKLIIIVVLFILAIGLVIMFVTYNNADKNAFEPFRRIIEDDNGMIIIEEKKPRQFMNMVNSNRNIFMLQMIVTIVLICIIASSILYFVLSKILKPFEDLSKNISEIDENNLDRRLEIKPNSKEVNGVLNSFNHLLERLSNAFSSQKLFSANVAHELKTPLTVIKTNKQVFDLNDKPSKKEYKELVELMDKQSNRLIEIVDTLLKMNDKYNLLSSDFSVREVIQDIESDLEMVIKSKDIVININSDKIIKSDKSLFKRAIFNIVDNAIKYSGESKVIDINISDKELEIIDYGIGIDIDNPNQIFEAFYRVDNSRSRLSGGSGLGLALTKQILDLLEMKVSYQNREDGTTFIVNYEMLEEQENE